MVEIGLNLDMAWSSGILLLLALLHSLLGEQAILKPLFARSWDLGIERYAVERILRFAWHITSFAWIGFAAILLGCSAPSVIAWTCVATGLLIFFMLRGHLAWPLFFLAACFIWEFDKSWPGGDLLAWCALGFGFLIAGGAAAMHVYWALGGSAGLHAVIPRRPTDEPGFRPGPLACLTVSVALLIWGGCLAAPFWAEPGSFVRWLLWASVALFCVRAMGDGRQIGFTKKDHSTTFARWDDALFSPLVVAMLLASLSALKMTR